MLIRQEDQSWTPKEASVLSAHSGDDHRFHPVLITSDSAPRSTTVRADKTSPTLVWTESVNHLSLNSSEDFSIWPAGKPGSSRLPLPFACFCAPSLHHAPSLQCLNVENQKYISMLRKRERVLISFLPF